MFFFSFVYIDGVHEGRRTKNNRRLSALSIASIREILEQISNIWIQFLIHKPCGLGLGAFSAENGKLGAKYLAAAELQSNAAKVRREEFLGKFESIFC